MRRYLKFYAVGLLILLVGLAACAEPEEPTAVPQPTSAPTVAPTEAPTEEPTVEPTIEPTPEPTAAPTAEPTEEPTAEPTAVPDPTEEPADVAEPAATVLPAELTGKTWSWISMTDPVSGTQLIEEPERYTLILNDDGRLNLLADCNVGNGDYTVEGSSVSIVVGAVTRAACPPDSLADVFLENLEAAAIYFTDGDDLLFDLIYDSGTMRFTAVAEEPADEEETELGEISPESIQMELQGLASTYTWEVVPGSPAATGPGGSPATSSYILLTFDEADAETTLAEGGPRLYVFPVENYIVAAGDIVEAQVTRLQELIDGADGRSETPEDPMPVLPPPVSFMGRWAQFADLDFVQGTGVRYVSEAINRQEIGPWTNNGTAYYYQGLTADGRYYVSFVWPVRTDSLPDIIEDVDEETMTAATASAESYEAYLVETQNALNLLLSGDWEPDLADLDALIQSLTLFD